MPALYQIIDQKKVSILDILDQHNSNQPDSSPNTIEYRETINYLKKISKVKDPESIKNFLLEIKEFKKNNDISSELLTQIINLQIVDLETIKSILQYNGYEIFKGDLIINLKNLLNKYLA